MSLSAPGLGCLRIASPDDILRIGIVAVAGFRYSQIQWVSISLCAKRAFSRKITYSLSTPLLLLLLMATPRRPLGLINGNRTPGNGLSPYLHGRTVGRYEEGQNKSQITKDLKVLESTVRSTLSLDPQRIEGKTKPRSGAPSRYL